MEGPSRVLSRSSEDLYSYISLAEEEEEEEEEEKDEDLFSCSPSSPEDLPHSITMPLDWEDSRADGLPKEMEAALSAAMSSRSLTPLLKEELRCKIQLRRLQHGEEEITPDFSTKPPEMSLEEVAKKNRKMQQNRMSAQRSRNRQKSLEKTIKSRLGLLENQNRLLKEQAQALRHACRVARDWLHQHRSCLQTTDSLPCSVPVPSLSLTVTASDSASSPLASVAASASVSSLLTRVVHTGNASCRSVTSQM